MSVKIINVLKDDSFTDILELFRQAAPGEVILVLPRVSKLFKSEDHFAAFASEAKQGSKTVSVLTANPETATLARKFGFSVMASGSGTAKPVKARAKVKKMVDDVPAIQHSAPPADEDTPSDDDAAPQSDLEINDVPLTSDETMGIEPEAEPEIEPVAELTVAKKERLDYIDAVWRDKGSRRAPPPSRFLSKNPSAFLTVISKRTAMGILAAAVVVLGAVVYLMTGSAHITLTPVSTPVDTQITVQTSDTFATVDAAFAKLPGQLIELTKTGSNTVAASGTRDVASKARGKIVISNLYSSTAQTLVATTRFASADGHVFRTLQTITVPGSTVKAGVPVPGTVTVDVIADKPGPEYNVPAGDFVIMAFKEKGDAEKVKQFYGHADQAMSGGASGPSKVVTQADYDTAVSAATAAVKDQVQQALIAQGTSLTVLNADKPALGTVQSTAHPDDAAAEVTVTIAGTLKTVAFRQADLKELIRATILKNDRLVVLPDRLKFDYRDITFKPDLGILTFTVAVTGTGYAPVDTDAIRKDIQGKTGQQIHDYFTGRDGVRSALATLSPFWVRSAPKDPGHISIDINYDADNATGR